MIEKNNKAMGVCIERSKNQQGISGDFVVVVVVVVVTIVQLVYLVCTRKIPYVPLTRPNN